MFRKPRLYLPPWLLTPVIALVGVVTLCLAATPLSAHGGGVPRLTNELAGPYRIFAWTQPEPLRAGDIHLSIAVVKDAPSAGQSAERLDEPITDATVTIYLQPADQEGPPLVAPALLQEQLGSYYYEADATLPTVGDWRFTIEVSGALGQGSATFVGTVLATRRINWPLVIAAGALLLGLLALIGLWNRMQAKTTTDVDRI